MSKILAAALVMALRSVEAHEAHQRQSASAAEMPFGRAGDPKKASRTVEVDMSDRMRR